MHNPKLYAWLSIPQFLSVTLTPPLSFEYEDS